jgi:hypothetical protein
MQRRTRREMITAVAATAASAPFAGAQHQHGNDLAQISGTDKPKVFSPAEMEGLSKLTDAILPRTDTPGASDAGVPAWIDRKAQETPGLTERLREGFAALDSEATRKFGAKFTVLNAAQVDELLTAASAAPDRPQGRFFRLIKDLTIDGYYSSQQGLAQELGWHGNTFLPEFKGCTHPEHQH